MSTTEAYLARAEAGLVCLNAKYDLIEQRLEEAERELARAEVQGQALQFIVTCVILRLRMLEREQKRLGNS